MTEAALLADGYLLSSLPTVWFGVVLFALAMYLLLDGIDFGIGVLYATRSSEAERETLLAAFGPIWDANEVWLVAFGTTLLAAFPPVYSRLLADHYLLVITFVMALLLRGIGPELREQREDRRWQRRFDLSFVVGSALAPLLLGMLAGSWVFAVSPFSLPALLLGVGVVALSVTTGAAFLATKTGPKLSTDMRKYGTVATAAYLGGVVVLLATVVLTDPAGTAATVRSVPAVLLVGASVVAGTAAIVFARRGSDRALLGSALALPPLVTALVAVLLYPTLYPATGLTVEAAVVSPLALNLVTVLGLPVLVLVLWYFKFLYTVFSGPVGTESYDA